MGATATYFRHIKEAVARIFDGMAVSASHLIRKPHTIQYPDRMPVRVQDTLPFGYRGFLVVCMEVFTGCLACGQGGGCREGGGGRFAGGPAPPAGATACRCGAKASTPPRDRRRGRTRADGRGPSPGGVASACCCYAAAGSACAGHPTTTGP